MPPKLALGEDPQPPHAYMADWSHGRAVAPLFLGFVIGACSLLVVASLFVVARASRLEVSASPSAESIYQRTGTVKAVSDRAVLAWARSTVQLMEAWNNDTLPDQATRVTPFVHPRFRATIGEDYDALIKQVRGLYFSRAVSVFDPTLSSSGDGRYVVRIPYEQFDYSGSNRDNRLAVSPTAMIIELDVIQDLGSDDNPSGLFIVGRSRTDRETWVKQGREDYWKNYRFKKVEK